MTRCLSNFVGGGVSDRVNVESFAMSHSYRTQDSIATLRGRVSAAVRGVPLPKLSTTGLRASPVIPAHPESPPACIGAWVTAFNPRGAPVLTQSCQWPWNASACAEPCERLISTPRPPSAPRKKFATQIRNVEGREIVGTAILCVDALVHPRLCASGGIDISAARSCR